MAVNLDERPEIVAAMSAAELALFRAIGGETGRSKGEVIADLHQPPRLATWREVFAWNSDDIEPICEERRERARQKQQERKRVMAASFAEYQREYRRRKGLHVRRTAA